MTLEESERYQRLIVIHKERLYASPAMKKYLRKQKGPKPEELTSLENEWREFITANGQKILREHKSEVFLNYCPRCGALARTPSAKQCPTCFYSWREGN